MAELTVKQEKFCQIYVDCSDKSKAYRDAYDTQASARVVHVKAAELAAKPHIAARIQEIQEQLEEKNLWRRIHSVKTLAEIAQTGDKNADRINAVKALNAMHGWDRHVIDHTSSDGSMSPTRIEITAPAEAEHDDSED